MQAIIEGPVHLEKASYTILTFVVLRPGKPPHDAAGSEWFVVDSILKLGANDGVIFLEDLWILLQSEQESRKASATQVIVGWQRVMALTPWQGDLITIGSHLH